MRTLVLALLSGSVLAACNPSMPQQKADHFPPPNLSSTADNPPVGTRLSPPQPGEPVVCPTAGGC